MKGRRDSPGSPRRESHRNYLLGPGAALAKRKRNGEDLVGKRWTELVGGGGTEKKEQGRQTGVLKEIEAKDLVSEKKRKEAKE